MSHHHPRLIANTAGATFVNSMHGVRLDGDLLPVPVEALPLLAMNSVTLLGAEIFGRSYGGGILKMEPREAARLPMPAIADLPAAWRRLHGSAAQLDEWMATGRWTDVVVRVDEVLLLEVLGLSKTAVRDLQHAVASLRSRRLATSALPSPRR